MDLDICVCVFFSPWGHVNFMIIFGHRYVILVTCAVCLILIGPKNFAALWLVTPISSPYYYWSGMAKKTPFLFWRCLDSLRLKGSRAEYLSRITKLYRENWRTLKWRKECQWSFGEIIGHWRSFCSLREGAWRLHHHFIWKLRRMEKRSTLF